MLAPSTPGAVQPAARFSSTISSMSLVSTSSASMTSQGIALAQGLDMSLPDPSYSVDVLLHQRDSRPAVDPYRVEGPLSEVGVRFLVCAACKGCVVGAGVDTYDRCPNDRYGPCAHVSGCACLNSRGFNIGHGIACLQDRCFGGLELDQAARFGRSSADGPGRYSDIALGGRGPGEENNAHSPGAGLPASR